MSLQGIKKGTFEETQYDKALILKKEYSSGYYFTESSFKKISPIEFALQTTLNPILKGALIGTVTGTATGSLVGFVTAGPPGALAGAGKGAMIGLIVGVTGGLIYLLLPKCKFTAWKNKNAQDDVMQIFLQLHEDEKSLQEFICPLTLQPFECPVIDKFGNRYEKRAIEEWINLNKDNKGFATDPKRNGPICKKDLTIDYYTSAKLQNVYVNILRRESSTENIHPDVKEGLTYAVEQFEKNISAYMERETVGLLKKLRNKEITTQEYTKKLAELSVALG